MNWINLSNLASVRIELSFRASRILSVSSILASMLLSATERSGIDPKRAKLHSFPRTGATVLLQRNVPLPDVQKLGDWRNLASI
jgi:hypothetical protein